LYVSRLGGAGSRRFAIVFSDITERKRREANLAFLAELAEDFSRLWVVDEIMRTVGEKLPRFLRIRRCHFALVDEPRGECRILDHWNDPSLAPLPPLIGLSDHTNDAVQHSGCSRIGVTLEVRDGEVHGLVEDDGATPSWGVGPRSMRDRAEMLGGNLGVDSNRDGGTRVEVRVPLGGRRG
jgi:hypothetical protein